MTRPSLLRDLDGTLFDARPGIVASIHAAALPGAIADAMG